MELDKTLVKEGFRRPRSTLINQTKNSSLNSISYRNTSNTFALHVHWNLLNSTIARYHGSRINMETIWRKVQYYDGKPHMRTEHHLIHLAEHAVRHSFERLILLRDIAETTRRFNDSLNWNMLVQESMDWGLAGHVYYGLLFAVEKAGAVIPRTVMREIQPARPGAGARIFTHAVRKGIRKTESCNLLFFSLDPTFKGRLKLVKNILFPPKKVLSAAYGIEPEKIKTAFYVKRAVRGAISFLRLPEKLIKHAT